MKTEIHGHVNSISVLRSHRRLGLAKKLMLLSRTFSKKKKHLNFLLLTAKKEEAMSSVYKASYVSLHVRKSNKAAISLYRDALGFEISRVEKSYCELSSIPVFRFLENFDLLTFRKIRWRWRRRVLDASFFEERGNERQIRRGASIR